MRVMAQMAMVMNLDKCIGCHTCSVTCKQAWTNRSGAGVRLVQQRGDPPRSGISAYLPGPGQLAGWVGAESSRTVEAQRRCAGAEVGNDFR